MSKTSPKAAFPYSKNKASKLGILFLHHTINRVVHHNLKSIRDHNPGATVVTMSARSPLTGGYSLNGTPMLKKIHSRNRKRGSDWLVLSWFLQRKEMCNKWWIVEWDTFSTISVKQYYASVWHFPFIASSVRLPYREPEWPWFRGLHNLHEDYRPYISGAVPFLYLISDFALKCICQTLLNNPITLGNAELRFSTAANKCGVAPCGFSPPLDRITWMPWNFMTKHAAISHPVKLIMSSKSSATNA